MVSLLPTDMQVHVRKIQNAGKAERVELVLSRGNGYFAYIIAKERRDEHARVSLRMNECVSRCEVADRLQ